MTDSKSVDSGFVDDPLMDHVNNLTSHVGLVMSSGIIGWVVNNMFGTDEKIPKGVVRELMEGVMDGLMSHFQWQIDQYKQAVEEKQGKIDELETKLEKCSCSS